MESLYINIIRGLVTNFFILLHMFIAGEAKYSKKVTSVAFVVVYLFVSCIVVSMYFFIDITTISKYGALTWFACGMFCKYFFTDSIMKWMFNVITVINVFIFVVIISYSFSDTHAGLLTIRVLLYILIIFGFHKYLRPLYRQVANRWHIFFAASVVILLNFIYAIITASDIQRMLTEDFISLMLMVLSMFIIYATIFLSFNSIIKEYEYRIEKNQAKLNESFLINELKTYEEFVESSKRHRHDLRHHNQIMMGYIKDKDLQGAEEYLKLYEASITDSAMEQYTKNYIANAVLCLYARKAQVEEITFAANADIPQNLAITPPEFGSMLSNILENAIEACKRSEYKESFITFNAETQDENLKIEIRNTLSGMVKFENDLPISNKENGGIGTKSVLMIVSKYRGMIHYKQEEDIFITQIVLQI